MPPNIPLAVPTHREILLPAYVAFVVKSLRNINAAGQTIDLAFTLVIRIDFGGLPRELTNELTHALAFRFNESPLHYDVEHADSKWKGSLFVVTLRLQLSGVVFEGESVDFDVWKEFPFDEPKLAFRLEFTSHTVEHGRLKGWKVRYNVHEYTGEPAQPEQLLHHERIKPMMSFKRAADSLPAFDVKMNALDVSFQAERKTQDGVTFRYFAVVTFHIPLFRHPGAAMRSMVFPLGVLEIGAVMTLFMSPLKYEERISTLVTVLLALFAFLSYARTALPDVPVSTWLEMQIFYSVLMCLIGMLETLLAKYEYAGANLVEPGTKLQSDGYLPSQWTFSAPGLVPTQTASRCVRIALLGVILLIMLRTGWQISMRMRKYYTMLAANSAITEMKKRSTDFDASAYGWAKDRDVATRAERRNSLTGRRVKEKASVKRSPEPSSTAAADGPSELNA